MVLWAEALQANLRHFPCHFRDFFMLNILDRNCKPLISRTEHVRNPKFLSDFLPIFFILHSLWRPRIHAFFSCPCHLWILIQVLTKNHDLGALKSTNYLMLDWSPGVIDTTVGNFTLEEFAYPPIFSVSVLILHYQVWQDNRCWPIWSSFWTPELG